jgi:hypothetical protein
MNPIPVTARSESTIVEQLTHAAVRALEWARQWYPNGEFAVTGISEGEATVLVEVDGDIRILRYEDLDRGGPRCERCGRPL